MYDVAALTEPWFEYQDNDEHPRMISKSVDAVYSTRNLIYQQQAYNKTINDNTINDIVQLQ